jgi:starch-binding outer membrane protein, SusD/RagB family
MPDVRDPRWTAARRRRAGAGRAAAVPLLLALALGACDSLLEVSMPGAVNEADLNDPRMARALVVGAIGKFECAVTQYALVTGILANEFWTSSGFRVANAWSQRLDAARESNGACATARGAVGMGAFFGLQQARTQSEEAYRLISDFPEAETHEKVRSLAKLAAYGGYAYALLGEGMCEVTLDGGPSMTPQAVLAIAEERLTTAIGHAEQAGDQQIRLMALVGRARVRLNLGKNALAAQDAAQIPEGFVRYAQHSTTAGVRENRVWGVVNFARAMSVTTEYRGLMVDGVPDPRVPVQDTGGPGQDGTTRSWIQLKFPAADSWTPIASWEEAQLIIAEVEGGQTAVGIINRLRDAHDLPHFQSNDDAAIRAQVIEERKRQLFAEGHRLNDMLRHNIPFPGPVDHQGTTYGPMTCMFLPLAETNTNPNL